MLGGVIPASGLSGFTGGVGLNMFQTQVYYSITPFGALGNAQKISLKKKF